MRTASRGYDPRSFDHLPATFGRLLTLVGGPLVDYLTDLLAFTPMYRAIAMRWQAVEWPTA